MKQFDVVGIGNPLLDLVYEVDEEFLAEVELSKAGMFLISQEQSQTLLDRLENISRVVGPGGSAANTVTGVALLGGKSLLMGMVGRDGHAELYDSCLCTSGAQARFSFDSLPTGHAIALITPDGERTFAVYLGAAMQFREQHVDRDSISQSKFLHIEGYQLEGEQLAAAKAAMKHAKERNTKVSIDLADPHLIGRAKTDMQRLVAAYADIIFLNEEEAHAYTGKRGEEALQELAKECDTVFLKLGEKGSLVWHNQEITHIPAQQVTVENLNGAGDGYAAGVLYALAREHSPVKAAHLGTLVAAQVVQSSTARPEKPIHVLANAYKSSENTE